MACPQKENGYTPIANEIMEALCVIDLSRYESKFIFALLRRTYGFQKKSDYISNSQFVKATGLYKAHISNTETGLMKRKIVTKIGNKIGINKNYEEWLQKDLVTQIGNSVTQIGNKKLPKSVDTIDTTKETIQKISDKSELSSKKDNMRTYDENKHFEEEVIDLDSGEVVKPTKPKKEKKPNLVIDIIQWAEELRKKKFTNYGKQMKYVAMMLNDGEKTPDEIADRWEEMAKDAFWIKIGGFDFKNVADSFDRK